MDIYQVVILSGIEGVTEFLPISSTAHLILTSHILQIPSSDFLTSFEISIQLGAIASVAFLYFDKIRKNKKLLYKAAVGFIPTGILGFTFFKLVKSFFENSYIPVASLFIGGLAIIILEYYFSKKNDDKGYKTRNLSTLRYKDALCVGLIQSLAMIPGVSRSGASIFGAMALKFDRKSAIEFSFILALPTMIAATGYDLVKSASNFNNSQLIYIGVGIVLSFFFAVATIKWLLRYVTNNNLMIFGVYRILISIIYYFIFLR